MGRDRSQHWWGEAPERTKTPGKVDRVRRYCLASGRFAADLSDVAF